MYYCRRRAIAETDLCGAARAVGISIEQIVFRAIIVVLRRSVRSARQRTRTRCRRGGSTRPGARFAVHTGGGGRPRGGVPRAPPGSFVRARPRGAPRPRSRSRGGVLVGRRHGTLRARGGARGLEGARRGSRRAAGGGGARFRSRRQAAFAYRRTIRVPVSEDDGAGRAEARLRRGSRRKARSERR